MADNLTMEELLQAPTEGYGEAIVTPKINADHFEIKTNLLQLVQANLYHGFERENPHTHINNFKRITSTLNFKDVSNDVIKQLAQIDTFYNGLNDNDQDSLNAAAGGNLLSKTTREALQIIKNKSKVRYSRNKLNISRMNTNSRKNASKTDDRIDKLADQISTLVDIFAKKAVTPALVKAVEESCVTCGGPHAHYNCDATNSNQPSVCVATDLHFDISFANALLLMPKFASTIKSLLTNKDKLFELAKIPLNENFSAMLLKKLPEKLGDPNKFLILCDFLGMDVCHALADLGASINLMPLSISKKVSLPELTTTRMTLELANRSITHPKGVAEDVFVKVGKFHFPTDFVVVDFKADPRVPLILGRSFLRTGRALIDIYGEEITIQVNEEAVTFNLNQTTRYSSTYDDLSVNQIDIIEVSREEYAQEILGFSKNSLGGNSTSTSEPILFDSSPFITPFEGSDFILEEIEAYLKDESISPEIDHADCDPEGDICLIENLLNNDPFQLSPMDLKQGEVVKAKSLIKEPPELELKDLLSHLEYAYLEGVDKLPVIIAKYNEKEALLKVLKSHKRAIAWKITNVKVIDPRFCTHKILMEEDYKPAVQNQRRVNPKIHEVIKKEVIKLLDAEMIYLIFDSPWVSPIHCVPKKGGITVVENENNELIPTRMPFVLCNAPGTFQRCMMAIFHDMIEKTMEVFMDDFSVFEDSFSSCLSHLDTMLQRCEDINLVLNWEKCHFMVKEGIVLGNKISKNGLEVDHAKIDVIAKLPHPTTVKGVRSFLGHAGFYQRFIQEFSKIGRPMTYLLEKETPFVFSKDCINDFLTLKKKLTEAPILVFPDWNLPFELMCNASDFAIVYTDHSALKYLLSKQDAKPRLIRWVLLLQEFDIIIRDKKGTENLVADHLSRLENPYKDVFENKDINENFLLETLGKISSESTLWDEMPRNVIQVCEIFDVCGIDFIGPFPSSRGNKYILVAVDYLSKWVEAKALPTNDARVVVKFLKWLFARFRTPRAIISDRGTHFCNDKFAKAMFKYEVTHRLATAYHPQTSGQVEVSNQGLKRILERTVGKNRASWSKKLKDALWAFRTAYKKPIGCTPYKLVYGKSCHLPTELEHKAYWALKHVTFDLKIAGGHQKLQLNKLHELHDQSYGNSLIYKEKTKKRHDSKIKNRIFNVGDRVLLFNSHLNIFLGNLKTR
nr:reverse transcriptase domain-containing protein [Tanacetum cinerariifolium]